jgi:amino acid permease
MIADVFFFPPAILTFIYASHASTFSSYVSLRRTARRHSWEAAAFLGLAPAAIIIFGWALVGHLAVPRPLSGNLFDSLPRGDNWLVFARLLVLVAAVSSLPSVVAPARDMLADGLRSVFGRKKKKNDKGKGTTTRPRGQRKAWRLGWKRRVSGAVMWLGVLAAALPLSPSGRGRLRDVVEVVGFTGGSVLGFVIPGTLKRATRACVGFLNF